MILTCVGEIAIVKLVDLVCTGLPLSVTATIKANVPAAVGVPETTPLGAMIKPVGRLPEVTFQV